MRRCEQRTFSCAARSRPVADSYSSTVVGTHSGPERSRRGGFEDSNLARAEDLVMCRFARSTAGMHFFKRQAVR
jgi:hypothetical protein